MPHSVNTDKPLPLSTVLEEEYAEQYGQHQFIPTEGAPEEEREEQRLEAIFKSIHALPSKRSALCLSGGGIRSATFCLGVLQGLARYSLLEKFDYLSTVSGGGYIGSWLTAWIHRKGKKHIQKELQSHPMSKTEPELKEISHLRAYSNYLSPKIGLLSADTWTLVSIYLRNLFLNWLVLLPLLLAVLLIPRVYVSLIRGHLGMNLIGIYGVYDYVSRFHLITALLTLGLLFLAMALAYIGSHRPSLRQLAKRPEETADDLRNFLVWCMAPLALSAFLLTVGRAWYINSGDSWGLWQFAVAGASLQILAWFFTFIAVQRSFGPATFSSFVRKPRSRFWELIVVTITGLLGGSFLWLLSIPEKFLSFSPSSHPWIYACFDGPRLMLVVLLMGVLSIIGNGSRIP